MRDLIKIKSSLKKTIFIVFLLIFLLIILSPILIFIISFKDFEISKEMTDWGALGSYIGGVTGSIISFFSLIILASITYIVAKNSNKENKTLFVLKKRIEAYDELMKIASKTNPITISHAKLIFKQKLNGIIGKELTPESIYETYIGLLSNFDFYPDFHYFIYNFNARYNHIFKFDFKSDTYKNLIKYSEQFNNSILACYNEFDLEKSLTNENKQYLDMESFSVMHKHLVDFVNELKKELD